MLFLFAAAILIGEVACSRVAGTVTESFELFLLVSTLNFLFFLASAISNL
jgi:hypothetical protein